MQTGYTTKIVKFIENFVSLDFWSEMKKICHARYGQIFRFGVKIIPLIFWFQKKTERTTEDILLVQTGYTIEIFKFIENFVSWHFWSEMKKICHAGLVIQYVQIWGKKTSVDFVVPNDTERTTEDIL